MTLRGGLRGIAAKQPDLVAHRAAADAADPQAGLDVVRERHALEVIAPGFDHEADDGTGVRIERACLNEVAVHDRVEKRIVLHVVDVAVDVVVHPACRDHAEMPVGGTQFGQRSLAHRSAFWPADISCVPSASARRRIADPGASGFCWLSWGAQADSQTISKVARMRPSGSAKRLA